MKFMKQEDIDVLINMNELLKSLREHILSISNDIRLVIKENSELKERISKLENERISNKELIIGGCIL